MEDLTRESVLRLLDRDWAEYVPRFQALPAAEQCAFLEKQGYRRLADLLAHIAAWWQAGLESIQRYGSDPDARQLEIEVDAFNARAVEAVRGVSDEVEMQAFEAVRLKFVEAVYALSEQELRDERVREQLRWELVNHLDEHKLPGSSS